MICKLVRGYSMGFHKLGIPITWFFLLIIQSMGQTPLSHSIEIQNSTKPPFSNLDLVWKDGFRHGSQNKVAIETAYIPHVCVF
jgi:hypothetical protein